MSYASKLLNDCGFIYQGASILAFLSEVHHLFIDSEWSLPFLFIVGFIEHFLTSNYM
jgi:hypothetical protein